MTPLPHPRDARVLAALTARAADTTPSPRLALIQAGEALVEDARAFDADPTPDNHADYKQSLRTILDLATKEWGKVSRMHPKVVAVSDRLLALLWARRAGDGLARVSLVDMAVSLTVSEPYVSRCITALVKSGAIEIVKSGRGGQPNIYRIAEAMP